MGSPIDIPVHHTRRSMDDVLNAFALLRRPALIILSISAFSIVAGSTFVLRSDIGTHGLFQHAIGVMLVLGGLTGMFLLGIHERSRRLARLLLAFAGSIIVAGFAFRGLSLWQALAFADLAPGAWSYYLVGGAQWIALSYMAMVAWFDVALPWVLARAR